LSKAIGARVRALHLDQVVSARPTVGSIDLANPDSLAYCPVTSR
jgi:hypothetical protein